MDYTIAKRLKEAGFPQHVDDIKGMTNVAWRAPLCIGDPAVYVPTSDELIEELGDKFAILSYSPESDRKWIAQPRYSKLNEEQVGSIGLRDTPLEALAGLYIALHQPKP